MAISIGRLTRGVDRMPFTRWTSRLALLLTATVTAAGLGMCSAQASSTNTRLDAWGTLELSGSGWLGGAGVDVFSNGANADGPSPDQFNFVNVPGVGSVQSGIKWQCVELVNRLYLSMGWTRARWPGDGQQMYANAPAGLLKEPNGAISYLSPGDVIGFSGGAHGHVAIVNAVSGSSVQLVNQNTVTVFSTLTLTGKTLSGWAGLTVQGVVHAPAPPSNRIGARLTDGTLVAKDGLSGAWVTEIGNVRQVVLSGNRIAAVLTDGTLVAKDGLTGAWVTETGNVRQVVLSGNRIGALLTSGVLVAKDGLTGAWVTETGNVRQVVMSGNRIAAVLTSGVLVAKDGLTGGWVTETGGVTSAVLN